MYALLIWAVHHGTQICTQRSCAVLGLLCIPVLQNTCLWSACLCGANVLNDALHIFAAQIHHISTTHAFASQD